jgi:hypothetical protein
MRTLASIFAAAALMGVASTAYAATAPGDITDINAARDSITLDNGSTFVAPKSADLSNFKVGDRISPAAGSDADLGG